MLSNSLPIDVVALQQLLTAEAHKNQLALDKIAALEREIHSLKAVLTAAESVAAPSIATTAKQAHEFSGELILVVDDQALNLNIVASLLEDEHLEVVCKNSAHAALEYLQTNIPALILMDIQMPYMDGYEATAKIRADYSQAAPIILAMTANNSAADKQKCLAAGMQGHIGKPIDANYLIDQLHFWLAHNSASDNLNANQPCQNTNISGASYPVTLDETQESGLPGIDLTSALMRLRGNRKLLEEVLVSFAQKAASIIPELHQAIEQNNVCDATRILHRLKGTSANLSAYKVAPLAAELEAQCKNNHLPSADQLAQLELNINQLITTAAQLQQTAVEASHEHSSVDRSLIEPLLQCICVNLHSDLGKAEDAVEKLNAICANSTWSTEAKQLRELFYQFNLRAVKDLISQGFQG